MGLVVVLSTVGGGGAELSELGWLGLLCRLRGWKVLPVGAWGWAGMVLVVAMVLRVVLRWLWSWWRLVSLLLSLLLLLLLLLLKLPGGIDDTPSNCILVVVILFLNVLVNLFVVSGNVNSQGVLGGTALVTVGTWMHLYQFHRRVGRTAWCWTWGESGIGCVVICVIGIGCLRSLGLRCVMDYMLNLWCCVGVSSTTASLRRRLWFVQREPL